MQRPHGGPRAILLAQVDEPGTASAGGLRREVYRAHGVATAWAHEQPFCAEALLAGVHLQGKRLPAHAQPQGRWRGDTLRLQHGSPPAGANMGRQLHHAPAGDAVSRSPAIGGGTVLPEAERAQRVGILNAREGLPSHS